MLKKILKILRNYYFLIVTAISVLSFLLGPYWVIITFSIFLSLIFVKYDYLKSKRKYFIFIFGFKSQNSILRIIQNLNVNFSIFLICPGFVFTDSVIYLLSNFCKKEKL